MRHQSAPGAPWLTGREDECAVSEALPVAGCSPWLRAARSHPSGSGRAGLRLSPGTRRSPAVRPSKGLQEGSHGSAVPSETHVHCSGSIFPASVPSSPAGMQPLTGKPNPPTMSSPSARDADFPFWMRKDLKSAGLRC